jgi:DNA replication protein DnaC
MTPCVCQRERKIQRELPARYQLARLSDFPVELQSRAARWIAHPGDGLLIEGPVGSGKTYLAAAIVRARIESGMRASFRRSADLYAALRESYRLNASESDLMGPYRDAQLLVLDNLGAGSLTDFERRITLEILDRRLNDRRPTVVTTNWELDAIAEKMDDRIASRLAMYVNFRLDGRDRRLAGFGGEKSLVLQHA